MFKLLISLFLFVSLSSAQAFSPSSILEIQTGKALDAKSDKTFIFFWATWCVTCKAKLKTVIPKMRERKDVNVLTLNIDKNPRRVKHYLKKNGIDVPVFRVKEGSKSNLIEDLNVRTAPQWAIFEKQADKTWKLKIHKKTFDKKQVDKALNNI